MRSFKEYLLEEYYFHGTSHEQAENIKKHGLDPTKSLFSNKLYMTKSYQEAHKYSKRKGKPGVVFKIHKSAIDPKHVHSDYSGIIEYTGKIEPKHISTI